ncbi:MAG: protein kinase domain-containing protein [Catenulispora sp.]
MRNGLVEGVSLRAVLRESGAMAPEAAASVLAGMLLTLAGVHGDVRPEKVLVDGSGGLTVTGFGASPGFHPAEPAYLAPEVLAGAAPTAAADVFAATAVFFECLTDEPPFRAATPEDLNALHEYTQIIAEFAPKELQPLIQRGLSADPAQRPESAHAFLAEVEAVASEAYGPDWQTRGRELLAAWATAAATVDGAELAAPAEMPEPPPVGEPIDERWLAGGSAAEADAASFDERTEALAAEPLAEQSAALEADSRAEPISEADSLAESVLDAEDDEALDASGEAGEVLASDLLSAFDDLAPTHEEPEDPEPDLLENPEPGLPADPEPDLPEDPEPEAPEETAAPATTLLIESAAEETAKLPREPLMSPSMQADIDHDWEIPAKPAPRSLSAYANSLPSLPRPAAEPVEPAEPVVTSAPDDWFRPGAAEPVDRGPRPTRQTAFLDPDREPTVAGRFDGVDDTPAEPEEEPEPAGAPGGPPRKTLVGAVTAAVLLVAGAAAVVLGGSGDSGPAPTAQSSTGASSTATGSPTPGPPTPTDTSTASGTAPGGVPTRHSSSHSSSHSKSTSSSSSPTGHSSSSDPTPSNSSASSGGTPTDTTSHSSSSSPSGSGSSSSSHSSSPPTETTSTSSPGGLLGN